MEKVLLEQFLSGGVTVPCWSQHLSGITPDLWSSQWFLRLNLSPCDLHASLETLVASPVKI